MGLLNSISVQTDVYLKNSCLCLETKAYNVYMSITLK